MKPYSNSVCLSVCYTKALSQNSYYQNSIITNDISEYGLVLRKLEWQN